MEDGQKRCPASNSVSQTLPLGFLLQKVASNGPQRLAAGGAATQNSPLVGMVELSITPKVHPKGFGCFPHTPREEAAEDLLLLLTLTRKHESQDGGS
jgi:hypothetical protein